MRINGAAVRDLRYRAGLNITDLALLTGIHHSNLGRIERGARPGTPAQHKRLAEALGVTMDDIALLDDGDGEVA